jgi:enoyl-CoA hydratase/carnithine racemase
MTDNNNLLVQWPSAGVCVLRLNRPRSYNALSRDLVACLRERIAQVAEQEVRVLLLMASEPGFCSGADLKERGAMSDEEKFAHNRAINALANELAAFRTPTIAVIDGVAMGGGCEIALACDFRFASDSALIGLTEARIGAIPGAGGTQRLPRLVGVPNALELMMSGEPVSGRRALEIGLVNRVATSEEIEGTALEFAACLASRSPRTAALLKQIVYRSIDLPLAEGLEMEGAAIPAVLASDDYREGIQAFAEKRQPNFR